MHPTARNVLLTGLVLLTTVPCDAGIEFKPDFAFAEFRDLSEAIADAIVFPNLGPASPGGMAGFEVLAAAGGPRVKTSSSWWRYGVNGSTTAGVMAAGRGVIRKGLPLRLDVGLQVGKLLSERLWGAELRWALLAGGVVEPAVALRVSHSRIEFGSLARFGVTEAQLVVSKGFTLLTPYVAGGYRRVEGRAFFGDPVARWWTTQAERWTAAAGVRLNLLPFRLVGEVRRGFSTSVFAGVGVGL